MHRARIAGRQQRPDSRGQRRRAVRIDDNASAERGEQCAEAAPPEALVLRGRRWRLPMRSRGCRRWPRGCARQDPDQRRAIARRPRRCAPRRRPGGEGAQRLRKSSSRRPRGGRIGRAASRRARANGRADFAQGLGTWSTDFAAGFRRVTNMVADEFGLFHHSAAGALPAPRRARRDHRRKMDAARAVRLVVVALREGQWAPAMPHKSISCT